MTEKEKEKFYNRIMDAKDDASANKIMQEAYDLSNNRENDKKGKDKVEKKDDIKGINQINKVSPKKQKSLPKTGTTSSVPLMMIGVTIIVSSAIILRKKSIEK